MSRTAAFRGLDTVGFPLETALRDSLLSTTLHLAGLNHAACLLVPSSFGRPWLGVHVVLAKQRLPQYASHFWVANAWEWLPPRQFRYVYSL